MTRISRSAIFLMAVLMVVAGQAAEQPQEASVCEGAVRLRARIEGDYLIVQATHEAGWHTYAMDNELRAAEKLAGKPSLGIEQGVVITVKSGGDVSPPWYQSAPHDLSKPELRWYTWGFDKEAIFACKRGPAGSEPVELQIRGQACNGKSCRSFNVELTAPPSASTGQQPAFSTDDLVQVRSQE